jgi:hypothetical protein
MSANLKKKRNFEISQDIFDRLARLVENCNNRLTLETVNILDDYIKGRLKICLKARTRRDGQEFQVMLLAAPFSSGDMSSHQKVLPITGADDKATSFPEYNSSQPERVGEDCLKGNGVFVAQVCSMDKPKQIITSLVRPKCPHHVPRSGGQLFRFVNQGIFEFIYGFAEREIGSTGSFSASYSDGAGEVVQSGSQIVECIASDGVQIERHLFDKLEPVNFLGSVSIYLGRDFIRTAGDIRFESFFEVYDVGFGPFDLGENPKKRFAVHDRLPFE